METTAKQPKALKAGAVSDAHRQVKAAKQLVKALKAKLKQARAAVKAAKAVRMEAQLAEERSKKPVVRRKIAASPAKQPAAVKSEQRRVAKPRRVVSRNAVVAAQVQLRPVPSRRETAVTRPPTEVVSLPAATSSQSS